MSNESWMTLSDLFNWDASDPLGLYPFKVRCLAVDFHPEKFQELQNLGKTTIDFIYGRSSYPGRQIKAGKVTLYFPERWLSVKEKIALMQSLYDLHETYPLKEVYIITGEPLFITDMTDEMVRVWKTNEHH